MKLLGQFQASLFFFYEKILNAQKRKSNQNHLTKKNKRTKNNKGKKFLRAEKLLRRSKLFPLLFGAFFTLKIFP